MAVLNNTAEGGSNGVTPTISDAGSGDPFSAINTGAVDSVIQYTNVSTMHGSIAYRLATRATGAALNLIWDQGSVGSTTVFHRFYFMVDVTPANDTVLAQLQQHNGTGSSAAQITITSAGPGALKLRSGGGTTAYTFTTTPTPGTWYRLEVSATCDGTTTCTIQARLYAGDNTVPIEDSGGVSVTNTGAVANLDRIVFGHIGTGANVPSSTGYQYYDDLQAFAATWPGPSVTATRPYVNVTIGGA